MLFYKMTCAPPAQHHDVDTKEPVTTTGTWPVIRELGPGTGCYALDFNRHIQGMENTRTFIDYGPVDNLRFAAEYHIKCMTFYLRYINAAKSITS